VSREWGTIHEESKAHKGAMASRYDTFKEEAQYLAGGFNARIQELSPLLAMLKSLRTQIPSLNKASGGTIVEVEDSDNNTRVKYFLLPAGGGNTYEVAGETYTVLSLSAPLARAFVGKMKEDEVEITIQGTTRHLIVVSVA